MRESPTLEKEELVAACPVCGSAATRLTDYLTQPKRILSKILIRMHLMMCRVCARVFKKEATILALFANVLSDETTAVNFRLIKEKLDQVESQINRESFEEEMAPHRGLFYSTALRFAGNRPDAEDLLQGASERAFRSYHTFESGTHFKAWFLRILTNLFWERGRKKEPLSFADEQKLNEICMEYEPDFQSDVVSNIGAEQIEDAIDSLPDKYRVVCVLSLLWGHSYQEIAETAELPVGTVRSRLHRGRKLLQANLLARGLARD